MGLKLVTFLILLAISAVHHAVVEPAPAGTVAICSKGTELGDCTAPQGIATDSETGTIYVADSGNHRIDTFESDGGNPTHFGEAEVQTWVAVDNDAASPSHHDVYVSSLGYQVRKYAPDGTEIERFGKKGDGRCQLMRTIDPIAIGPGGQVDVVDTDEVQPEVFENRVEQWSPEGKCEGEIPLFKGDLITRNFAVDSKGDFYVSVAGAGGQIWKYNPKGRLLYKTKGESVSEGLTIGPHDELFAKQSSTQVSKLAIVQLISEFSPSGKPIRRFRYLPRAGFVVEGMSVNPTTEGTLYASEQFVGVRYLPLPHGPAIVDEPCRAKKRTLSAHGATLVAEINPEGKPTSFHFTYSDGSKSKSTPTVQLGGRTDLELHEAAQSVTGLKPGTAYRCRVIAESHGSPPVRGGEGEFETAKH